MTEIDGKNLTLEQLMNVLDMFYNHAGAQNTQLSKFVSHSFFERSDMCFVFSFFFHTFLSPNKRKQNTGDI